MKLGQIVYYIDHFTNVPSDLDDYARQRHHIKEGRYLSEDSELTALVTIAATGHGVDYLGGLVIFLPNDQVTEDDDLHSKMSIVDAILARNGQ